MVGSSSSNFADLVITEERIENGLKKGKIASGSSKHYAVRRPYSGYAKKKEGDMNVITTSVQQYLVPMVPPPYYPYPYVTAA